MAKILNEHTIEAEYAGEIIDLTKLATLDNSILSNYVAQKVNLGKDALQIELKKQLEKEMHQEVKKQTSLIQTEAQLKLSKEINLVNEKHQEELKNANDKLNKLMQENDKKYQTEVSNLKEQIVKAHSEIDSIAKINDQKLKIEVSKVKEETDKEINLLKQTIEVKNAEIGAQEKLIEQKVENAVNIIKSENKLAINLLKQEIELKNAKITSQEEVAEQKMRAEITKINSENDIKLNSLKLELQAKDNEVSLKVENALLKDKEVLTKHFEKEIKAITVANDQKVSEIAAERDELRYAKRNMNIKLLGNELEEHVYRQLKPMFEISESEVRHVKSGAAGADIAIDVIAKSETLGSILIECKTFEDNKDNNFKNEWVRKLITDAAKENAKYKIIATYANKSFTDENVPFWIEDKENNVYVVRPEYVHWFVAILNTLIIKEASFRVNSDDLDLEARFKELEQTISNEIPALQKQLDERLQKIQKFATTIENNASKIKDEARKAIEKDMKKFINRVKEI